MITITTVERKKSGKVPKENRKDNLFKDAGKAAKFAGPYVAEMRRAKSQHREPEIRIESVSYDTESEKDRLVECGALITIER